MECTKGRTELADGKRRALTDEPESVRRAPLLRGTEGTQTGRILHVRNAITPLESRRECAPGNPTVRKDQPSSGSRKAREANAGGRKAMGSRARQAAPQPTVWITSRIQAECLARKGAHAGLVSLWSTR
jgi:hypothetical protein